jgi:hypothetical protein
MWPWTAVLVYALRQALCPSPGLLALLHATASGDLARILNDAPRRRTHQLARLHALLTDWILG